MRWPILRILWGLLLILAGVLFLLNSIGTITIGEYQWAIILGIGGLAFLSIFISDRNQWWWLFPAFGLFLTSAIIWFENAFPAISGDVSGVIAMGSIGLAFLLVFLINIANWWALIPAGVLLSSAAALLLSVISPGLESGGLFLVGLGLTFGVIGFVPTEQGRMRWAFIPAIVLLVIGLFVLIASFNLFTLIWPLGLIGAGVLIIYYVLRGRK
jgi:multisubunit Na+/H+ antiporter MnhC subunit